MSELMDLVRSSKSNEWATPQKCADAHTTSANL